MGDPEFNKCVYEETEDLNHSGISRENRLLEEERRNKEARQSMLEAQTEAIRVQKETAKRQIAEDDKKCTDNRFRKGTPQFTICKAINRCVNVVHTTYPMDSFYQHFDAFYNAGTGRVQNNATRNGDSDPLFIFNKCMSEQGIPLAD